MIHRITPRFKSLLHECHQIGNLSHSLFYFFTPILIVSFVQLVGGIFLANYGDGDEGEGGACVPGWVFAFLVQPVVSVLVFLHGE